MLALALSAYLATTYHSSGPRITPQQVADRVLISRSGGIVQIKTENIDRMPGHLIINISNGRILSIGVIHVEDTSLVPGYARRATFRLRSGETTRELNRSESNASCTGVISNTELARRLQCHRMRYNFLMSEDEARDLASYYNTGNGYWTYQLDDTPVGTRGEGPIGGVRHGVGAISPAEFAGALLAAEKFMTPRPGN